MNKKEALTHLDVCISNEELSLNNYINNLKSYPRMSDEDKLKEIKDSNFSLDRLKEVRNYVNQNLK